jgi:hypothetical protein
MLAPVAANAVFDADLPGLQERGVSLFLEYADNL